MPDVYMMSLRKPWSDLTVDGEKTMELRRSGCAIPPGSLVYIYESGPNGAGAIVGSVVIDRTSIAYTVSLDTASARELHQVPHEALWRYNGPDATALVAIQWRPGSAVRFPTPIPAPCKAVPTWRRLSDAELTVMANCPPT